MKNLMAYIQPQKPPQDSFEGRQMEHMAFNPIHEAHVQKAFQLKAPKPKMQGPQPNAQPGSPWLTMGVKR